MSAHIAVAGGCAALFCVWIAGVPLTARRLNDRRLRRHVTLPPAVREARDGRRHRDQQIALLTALAWPPYCAGVGLWRLVRLPGRAFRAVAASRALNPAQARAERLDPDASYAAQLAAYSTLCSAADMIRDLEARHGPQTVYAHIRRLHGDLTARADALDHPAPRLPARLARADGRGVTA